MLQWARKIEPPFLKPSIQYLDARTKSSHVRLAKLNVEGFPSHVSVEWTLKSRACGPNWIWCHPRNDDNIRRPVHRPAGSSHLWYDPWDDPQQHKLIFNGMAFLMLLAGPSLISRNGLCDLFFCLCHRRTAQRGNLLWLFDYFAISGHGQWEYHMWYAVAIGFSGYTTSGSWDIWDLLMPTHGPFARLYEMELKRYDIGSSVCIRTAIILSLSPMQHIFLTSQIYLIVHEALHWADIVLGTYNHLNQTIHSFEL